MARLSHVQRIERFIVRGRRLLATRLSIGEDIPSRVTPSPPPGNYLTLGFVDEESLDAVLARLRPLILEKEDLCYSRVIESVRATLQSRTPAAVAATNRILGEWDVLRKPTAEDKPAGFSDRFLAYRYLYGDLVHGDLPVGTFRMRIHAAQRLAFDGIRVTARTLFLLRSLDLSGLVRVPENAWIEQVSMDGARVAHLPLVAAYSAPLGTQLPRSFDEPLSDAWKPITPNASAPGSGGSG